MKKASLYFLIVFILLDTVNATMIKGGIVDIEVEFALISGQKSFGRWGILQDFRNDIQSKKGLPSTEEILTSGSLIEDDKLWLTDYFPVSEKTVILSVTSSSTSSQHNDTVEDVETTVETLLKNSATSLPAKYAPYIMIFNDDYVPWAALVCNYYLLDGGLFPIKVSLDPSLMELISSPVQSLDYGQNSFGCYPSYTL